MTDTADKLAEALRKVIKHCDGDTIEGLYALSDARETLAAYEREKAGQDLSPVCAICEQKPHGRHCPCWRLP